VAATQVAGGAQPAQHRAGGLLKRSPVLVERGAGRARRWSSAAVIVAEATSADGLGTSVTSQNGMRMKLRLFPQSEPVYFDLLEAAADNLTRAAETLLEVATDLTDVKVKADRLIALEQEGDRITRQMVTRLYSAFLAHLDPDEFYALAVGLNDVVNAIEDAGDMLWAHQVTEPFPPVTEQARLIKQAAQQTAAGMRGLRHLDRDGLRAYRTAVDELERTGDRLYRQALAELFTFTGGEHPARYTLQWKDITESLEGALNQLARVAHRVEAFVLKHA
jgi:uncharacterized protein